MTACPIVIELVTEACKLFENNIPRVIPRVGSRERRVYASLNPTVESREVVSDKPSAQGKTYQTRSKNKNYRSEEIMANKIESTTKHFEKKKKRIVTAIKQCYNRIPKYKRL